MKTLRFLVYTDIHHDRLAARCVTLKDTLEIEAAVHRRVVTGKFDFSLFLGDRFLKREPEDEVKVKVDMALAQALQDRGENGAPHFSLIGNHDWTKNSREWHTSMSAHIAHRMVILMDRPGTWAGPGYLIHALPSGTTYNRERWTPDPTKLNLFAFHDIVKGSFMSDDGDQTFEEGLPVSVIDQPDWDFVMGGDLHVPQQLPLQNTRGGYIGSVLQRTRADADKRRGWLEVTATRESDTDRWNIETVFVSTRAFFHREVIEVRPGMTYHDIKIDEQVVNDVALEVRLRGKREDVDRVADEPRWQNYVDILGARGIEIVRDYQLEQGAAVVDMSTSSGVGDDLKLYLESGFVKLGGMQPNRIFETVRRLQG